MTIDGIDISTDYGAILLEASLPSIIAHPSLREPDKNDWAEEPGIEVDLSTPTLNKRNVAINLICEEVNIESLVNFLLLKTYRIYNFTELDKEYKLRFEGVSKYDTAKDLSIFTLKLVDDFPLYNYLTQVPSLSAADYGCTIDGTNIKDFGVNILEGTYASLEGFSTVKKRLEISNKVLSGVKVAESAQVFKEYDASLKCYMRQSITDFWSGYNGLLEALTQPQLRTLVANGKTYQCYYKSSKVAFLQVVKGVVFCEFSIKIVVV